MIFWITAAFAMPPDTAVWQDVQAEPRIACTTDNAKLWCRAWGVSPASVDAFARVIENRTDYPSIYPHVAEVVAISESVHYTRIAMPMPFSDRDQVFSADRTDVAGDRVYSWHAVETSAKPPVDGVVRLTDAAGEWRLHPRDDGGTDLRYTWCAEMGGSFPGVAKSRAAVMHATEMITQTRRVAETP